MSNLSKYLAFPYTDDNLYDDGNVAFILLELTPEFKLTLADMAVAVVKALRVSHEAGFTLQSLAFWNADPVLVKYDFDDGERQRFSADMDNIYDTVEFTLDEARDGHVVLELEKDVVDKLPTEWPDYKEMCIDAQGLWVQWEYILDSGATTRFVWYPDEKHSWILNPIVLTWKQLQEKDNAIANEG